MGKVRPGIVLMRNVRLGIHQRRKVRLALDEKSWTGQKMTKVTLVIRREKLERALGYKN